MSENEVFIALQLAWIVGVWHLLVAGYLVFISGSRDELLLVMALVKGLLGGCVYMLVRKPEWVFYQSIKGYMLPTTLIILLVFSMLVTLVMWRAFSLDAPWIRCRKITDACTCLDLYRPNRDPPDSNDTDHDDHDHDHDHDRNPDP